MHSEILQKTKKFILLGYGLEGKASEIWLQKNFSKAEIEIIERIDEPLTEIKSDAVYVISPGISRQKICYNIPTEKQTSGTEIFFHSLTEDQRKKVIGISGSKGKTTTTKFTHELLQNAGFKTKIGGNFGVPLLSLWGELDELDFIVAELSSYQLENVQVSPYYSIFLNFFTDHVVRHGSLEGYWNAKQNLWAGKQKKSAQLFIPQNFVSVDKIFSLERIKDSSIWPIGNSITRINNCKPFEVKFFPDGSIFQSPHFCQNFGCSVKLLKHILKRHSELDSESLISQSSKKTNAKNIIQTTAQNFCGEPHRIELFAEKNGIKFYDDSISTNTFAARAVVEFFAENLGAIVLGGKSESGDSGDDWVGLLTDLQNKSPQAYLWLPESDTLDAILAAVEATGFPNEKIRRGANFSALLEIGLPLVQKKSAVVLSPAAKSFDRFKSYKERGNAWKEAITSTKRCFLPKFELFFLLSLVYKFFF